MLKLRLTLSYLLLAVLAVACAGNTGAQANQEQPTNLVDTTITAETPSQTTLEDCPVTVPQDPPFVPPPPYDQLGFEGEFWHGSNSLWTAVRKNGTWESLPNSPEGYTQKIFWWRQGYSASQEQKPDLTVTAERLDAEAAPVKGSKATNASGGDIGSAMLVGVDFPTQGCWKITGKYMDSELSFVVWIEP